MEPLTTLAVTMLINRLLAPIIHDGWKIISNADAKEERKRVEAKKTDFKYHRMLKTVDLQNQLSLQRSNHELRLQEARNSHKLALERWGIETYYKNCWPLRNPFEMQICESISDDKSYFNENVIVPCRLISALKDSDHPYAKTINGTMSSFIVNYYPTNSVHAVTSEIGAWRDDAPSNDASVNYLYAGLKKQPVMVLSPTLINDGKTFIFKVWSWGLGEELNYPAGFEFGRLELKPLYIMTVYEETLAMVQFAQEMGYAPDRFSQKLRHNVAIIKEIQDKKPEGKVKERILSFLQDAPEIDEAVKTKMEAKISGVFCCISAMYADTYHLLEYKTLPKLPSILPHIPHIQYMLPALKDYYYALLETFDELESDKGFLANLYLDIAESFSKLPFSFDNQEQIILPFVQKALARHLQSMGTTRRENELNNPETLTAIVTMDCKYHPFVKRANAVLKRSNLETYEN